MSRFQGNIHAPVWRFPGGLSFRAVTLLGIVALSALSVKPRVISAKPAHGNRQSDTGACFMSGDLRLPQFLSAPTAFSGNTPERPVWAGAASCRASTEATKRPQARGNSTARAPVSLGRISLSPTGDALGHDGDFGVAFRAVEGMRRGLAAYRYGPWKAWTKPMAIRRITDLPEDDVLFFLWQRGDGQYGALVPMAGRQHKVTIGQKRIGNRAWLALRAYRGAGAGAVTDIAMAAVGVGRDPFAVIDQTYRYAMKHTVSLDPGTEQQPRWQPRSEKRFPEALDQLGWCTWNAMKKDQSQSRLEQGLDTFKKAGFPLGFLLLDDGWFTEENKALAGFGGDLNKYPQGLSALVSTAKQNYGVKQVGVWHTINGYWNGIAPSFARAKGLMNTLSVYKDAHPSVEPAARAAAEKHDVLCPDFRSSAGADFYDAWYRSLRADGIDFVKVDNQLVVDRVATGSGTPVREVAYWMQKNLQDAVAQHFGGRLSTAWI